VSYCPLMLSTNGLHYGDGPDAKFLNKSRECRADCAWRIGDDCAMAVLARAAVKPEPSAQSVFVGVNDGTRSCDTCANRMTAGTYRPCLSCQNYSHWVQGA
jgi:hypothetical protein